MGEAGDEQRGGPAAELEKLELIRGAREIASETGAGGGPPGAAPPADSFPGYDVVEEVHRGGQGVVYLAVHAASGRRVAIKVIRKGPFAGPRDAARFDREVQILDRLRHPNIVAVHESGSTAGSTFFVMDYVEGQPLDEHVESASLAPRDVIELVAMVCEAVNVAHLRGVIHRDLKPSNIRVDASGTPHVLDFGLAKVADAVAERRTEVATLTGQFVGSLPWASPEQVEGRSEAIDVRTDVYSLGVILFQLLTGRFPYDVMGGTREAMDNIVGAEPDRPGSVCRALDHEIDTILLKCLSKDPSRRYQGAGELARDLRSYLAGEPIEAKRDRTWYMLGKTIRRHRAAVVVAAGVATLVVAFAVTMFFMYQRARGAERLSEQRRVESDRKARNVQLALDGLAAIFNRGKSEMVSDRQVLDEETEAHLASLEGTPEAQATFLESVASTCEGLEYWDLATRWRRRAVEIRRNRLGQDDLQLVEPQIKLAAALARADGLGEAVMLHRQVLETRRRLLGPQHPDVAASMFALAGVLHRAGEYDEPDRLYRDALDMRRRVREAPHPDLLVSLAGYGSFLQNKGAYAEAEQLVGEALAMSRELHEGDNLQLATMVGLYSMVLHDTGRYEQALPYRLEHVEMIQRMYPADHAAVGVATEQLGLLYKDMGRYERAEPLLTGALQINLQYFGGTAVGTAYTYHCLAKLYTDWGRYDQAEPYCRTALQLHRELYAEGHRNIARPLTHLGRILVAQGRHAEAEPLLREALEIRRLRKPPVHWKTAKTESILGAALTGLGRFEEAEPLLVRSQPVIAADRGAGNRRAVEAQVRVVELYEAWGKPEEAARHRARIPADSPWAGR